MIFTEQDRQEMEEAVKSIVGALIAAATPLRVVRFDVYAGLSERINGKREEKP